MTQPPATCPVCGHPTDMRYRPFCSRRCADVDLGRWFSGQYRVPADDNQSDMQENRPERVDPDDGLG